MTFQFNSLDQVKRNLLSVSLVQGTLLGPLRNIKLSDPAGMEPVASDEMCDIL